MKRFYATLPSGHKVVIPEDTLKDFRILYKGVPIKDKPEPAPLAKQVDAADLKSAS